MRRKTEKVKDQKSIIHSIKKDIKSYWQLYILLLLPLVYFVVFKYAPIYGAQMAFRDYSPVKGFSGSPWVGLKHFKMFFRSPQCWMLIRNTVSLSLYAIIAGFLVPIFLAIGFNYMANAKLKKILQTATFIPHFISTVVLVGILFQLFNTRMGILAKFLGIITNNSVDVLGDPKMFRHLYVWSGIWQSAGWNSVIYIAALAGVDTQLHEAAIVDGASKIKRIINVDIPAVAPVATIMFILNFGKVMSVGYEKVLLMQNSLNINYSEVIDTYVYKIGIATQGGSFSYPAAIGLVQSIISFILVVTVNKLSTKISETSLW